MVNFCAVCGCSTQTDIVREHLEDTLRICDVSAMGLLLVSAYPWWLMSRIIQTLVIVIHLTFASADNIDLGLNNNGLLTEREVCTVKYQTEVF
jgi:hypothetical protein